MRIAIRTKNHVLEGELAGGPTARLVAGALPIRGAARRWGEEIYFDVPITAGLEPDARQDVDEGDIGYWPEGPALCFFFGPTPVSRGPKPRAYSPVNVIGRIVGDLQVLRDVREGEEIVVERMD